VNEFAAICGWAVWGTSSNAVEVPPIVVSGSCSAEVVSGAGCGDVVCSAVEETPACSPEAVVCGRGVSRTVVPGGCSSDDVASAEEVVPNCSPAEVVCGTEV